MATNVLTTDLPTGAQVALAVIPGAEFVSLPVISEPAAGAALAPAKFGTLVTLDDQASPVVFNGYTFAAFQYTPLSTGLISFTFQWQGSTTANDTINLQVVQFTGGSIVGGTVIDEIAYAVGSVPVVSGTPVAFLAFATDAVAAAGAAFQGGSSANGLFQLTAGVTYTFRCNVVGGTVGRSYTNMSCTVAMRELLTP